jgi:hypothetical protein
MEEKMNDSGIREIDPRCVEQVRAFLELIAPGNLYLVGHTRGEEQLWKMLGLKLTERDEAISALAENGELEIIYYSIGLMVALKSKGGSHRLEAA